MYFIKYITKSMLRIPTIAALILSKHSECKRIDRLPSFVWTLCAKTETEDELKSLISVKKRLLNLQENISSSSVYSCFNFDYKDKKIVIREQYDFKENSDKTGSLDYILEFNDEYLRQTKPVGINIDNLHIYLTEEKREIINYIKDIITKNELTFCDLPCDVFPTQS